MFVGNVAQKMASGSFCSIEMEEKAMDGKRVSLPVLGLVLALIFVSSQAIYGGQIWDDDMGIRYRTRRRANTYRALLT